MRPSPRIALHRWATTEQSSAVQPAATRGMHPFHLLAILALLTGWHLDAVDARLVENHAAALNIPNPPPLIDNDERTQPIVLTQA